MRLLRAGAFVLLCIVTNITAGSAMTAAEEQERMMLAGGAWPAGRNVPCADAVTTSVHPRLEETAPGGHQTFLSGVVVEFKFPAAPKFLNGQPLERSSVVHYDGEPSNKLMETEKAGEKLQVCLVSFPTPTRDLQSGKTVCDPNVDPRGFVYRVYEYRRHGTYMGPDSQHSCGGA